MSGNLSVVDIAVVVALAVVVTHVVLAAERTVDRLWRRLRRRRTAKPNLAVPIVDDGMAEYAEIVARLTAKSEDPFERAAGPYLVAHEAQRRRLAQALDELP